MVTADLGKGQARQAMPSRVSGEARTLPPRPAASVARAPLPRPPRHFLHPPYLRADRERSRAARRSPGRVTRSIMGKLATVANRIVDRGELWVCPVKERRCQSTLSS